MSDETSIAKVEQKPKLAVSSRGLVPDSFEGLWRMATMVAGSAFAPRGMANQPESCMVAMAHGLEVGLGPMQAVQNIAVINGRPSIWGDAMIGLVLGSGLMTDHSLVYEGDPGTDGYTAVYTCQRRGMTQPSVSTYSVADARRAKLWEKAGPWTQYPKRMLGIRARAFGLRNNFADVLGGLYMAEEFGVDRESFTPDDMPSNQPAALEQVYGDDTKTDDEPVIEVIDAELDEPEIDPDTGEVIPDHVGRGDLFPNEGAERGYN